MKRKLIKQGGGGGLTLYLPKKWLDSKGLNGGDEVDVSVSKEKLVIRPEELKKISKEIELSIVGDREVTVRSIVINAYRAGYDRIIVNYGGDSAILKGLIRDYMIGMDLFEKKEGEYVIESVTEPSYDNFGKIIEKEFFIILAAMDLVGRPEMVDEDVKVKKYDNFLKRCISKNIISSSPYLWQFINGLMHISRQAYHLSEYLLKEGLKLDKDEREYIVELKTVVRLIQRSYLKKDLDLLSEVHSRYHDFVVKKGFAMLARDRTAKAHHLLYLGRTAYLAVSPLIGLLQVEVMELS